MLLVEICGSLVALGYIFLTIYEDNRCWYFAVLSSIIFAYIFFQAELYFESVLQWVFVVLSIRGAISWNSGKTREEPLIPRWMSYKERLTDGAFCIVGTLSLTAIAYSISVSRSISISIPPVVAYLDAFITVGSVVATIQATRKATESWLSWICVDLLASGLYVYKKLYITAFLYSIYTLLAVYGLNKWRAKKRSLWP